MNKVSFLINYKIELIKKLNFHIFLFIFLDSEEFIQIMNFKLKYLQY